MANNLTPTMSARIMLLAFTILTTRVRKNHGGVSRLLKSTAIALVTR